MSDNQKDKLRSLTYSLDILMPGLYFWFGNFAVIFGGSEVDDDPYYYPFIVPTFAGFGFVLPNSFSWHTPFKEFKEIPLKSNKTRRNIFKGFGIPVCH